jgi:tRNA(fMet)-specific endonuclease VapC
MIRYVIDTDHATFLENSDSACLKRLAEIDPTVIALTAVTVEERVQGWMNSIRQASAPKQAMKLSWAYKGLRSTVQYLAKFQIVDWTQEASDQFLEMRQQGVRIGTQDLRIASIALSLKAIVVTRNRRDFSQVPGLVIEDWTI